MSSLSAYVKRKPSHNRLVRMNEILQLEADSDARAWLDSHPSPEPRVIAYEVKRCCGGGKICSVRVRGRSRGDDVSKYSTAVMTDGTHFLVDPRGGSAAIALWADGARAGPISAPRPRSRRRAVGHPSLRLIGSPAAGVRPGSDGELSGAGRETEGDQCSNGVAGCREDNRANAGVAKRSRRRR